ncbi:MAG: 1,4-alpha-glucan branching protein GlgB [Lachnospiraceae bacterium]|nr:1,4-alpha-glucan branching protein GlgB [Lachnospiraceae bacterium]
MDKKLYKLMNWPRIESIVYSEEDHPSEILGAHKVSGGVLIQTYHPGAKDVYIYDKASNTEYRMELVDEEGFFAILLPQKTVKEYTYSVVYKDHTEKEIIDPYLFKTTVTKKDLERFHGGIHYEAYQKFGAHITEIDGVKGTEFVVWAPNAIRVSVVGDFNHWDGRIHQMERLWDGEVFSLFVPELSDNELYKFEVKMKNGLTVLKADPFSRCQQVRPYTASITQSNSEFKWTDDKYLTEREKKNYHMMPMNILEVYLTSFGKKEDGSFMNYQEMTEPLIAKLKERGATHVEFMPVMEHPLDESLGYQVLGYYAPTSRFGTPDDFKALINSLHKEGIGVILDWVPSHFPKDACGLGYFDGTALYHCEDPRKGEQPEWGTYVFDYGRKEVSNYLIANGLYWVEEFHADGIRFDAVSSMLYLDYGRRNGEWVANIYGGNENLEAAEFIKHFNSILHKKYKGVITIAEEASAWPMVTGELNEGGLGFDFKWNSGWKNDFYEYISYDPFFRSHHHNELTFSMIYQYCENFILPFSHDDVLLDKMPGTYDEKIANLKASYVYQMTHPGKKLNFMGIDSVTEDFVKDLNALYLSEKALYEWDALPEGFEWINNIASKENILVFLRKNKTDTVLVVLNFANKKYEQYKVGVPFEGKYKEIFCSDDEAYGGKGIRNKRVKTSKKEEADTREDSITIDIAPLSAHIFKCEKAATPSTKSVKKTAAKKSVSKKNLKAELELKYMQAEESIAKGSERIKE